MGDRKIILNAQVLTCDHDNHGGRLNLLVRDGCIEEIGNARERFEQLHRTAPIIDATNKIVLPGFVNAHCHSESFLFDVRTRAIPAATWKTDRAVREAEKRLLGSEDAVRVLYRATYEDHVRSGTTCVGEFLPPLDALDLRCVLGAIAEVGVLVCPTVSSMHGVDQIRRLRTEHVRFLIGLANEEEYTVYSLTSRLSVAAELGLPVVAHLVEQREGAELLRKRFHASPAEVLRQYALLGPGRLLLHLNQLVEPEVMKIADSGTPVVVCPRSAACKGTGYQSLPLLVSANPRPALGTDWASTDMLREAQFLAEVLALYDGGSSLSAADVLRMATIRGAEVLGVSSEVGSLEPGKRADLVFFDRPSFPVLPPNAGPDEIARFVLQYLGRGDISMVMIGGNLVVEQGRLVNGSMEDMDGRFRDLRTRCFPEESSELHIVRQPVSEELPVKSGRPSLTPVAKPKTHEPAGNTREDPSRLTRRSSTSTAGQVRPVLPQNVRRDFGEEEP
jgi:5-methylthioadenosine/S-adenosylhomocysteine deaminase